MANEGTFSFHGNLQDFLKKADRNKQVIYKFKDHPSVIDTIEAIGVPHPEVATVYVNGVLVHFSYLLQHGDKVEAYPYNHTGVTTGLTIDPASIKFVLDVHLGKLAKALRMLGFNTFYQNDYNDKAIVDIAERDRSVVLTRDVGLLKHKAIETGYWLRSDQPNDQLFEVMQRFGLVNSINPFSRCLECNGSIKEVAKEHVIESLPLNTQRYFQQFYQCDLCRRVYWKGSHYERMMEFVERIKALN